MSATSFRGIFGLALAMLSITPSLAAQTEAVECGPPDVKIKVKADKKEVRSLPEPSPRKALIYVLSTFGSPNPRFQTKFAVNGRWVGASPSGFRGSESYAYFYFEADPGVLSLCSKHRQYSPKFLYLTVEAGKTYYVDIFDLGELKQDKAADLVRRKCKYLTFTFEN